MKKLQAYTPDENGPGRNTSRGRSSVSVLPSLTFYYCLAVCFYYDNAIVSYRIIFAVYLRLGHDENLIGWGDDHIG